MCQYDIGEQMKSYAEEKDLLKNPQQVLIFSFIYENGTIYFTPFCNFYLGLVFQGTKIYRFVEYTPRKCFKNFVQSAVDDRREKDEKQTLWSCCWDDEASG